MPWPSTLELQSSQESWHMLGCAGLGCLEKQAQYIERRENAWW